MSVRTESRTRERILHYTKMILNKELHKQLGIELNQEVWKLLDKKNFTPEEEFALINAAHASLYHWSKAGTAINIIRGEWLVSRVYAVLNNGPEALYHANNCLEICKKHKVEDFDLAYAYEGLARSFQILNQSEDFEKHKQLAVVTGESIKNLDDKKLFISDMGDYWKE